MQRLNHFHAFFMRTASMLENHPTPLLRYYFFFVAILAVRLALEFFSSHRLFTLDDILHIGLWFACIVLAFLLQLHLFSGERVAKTARLVITCFTFALSAPILDLVITGGIGAKMNYLSLNRWQDVVWAYVTVGGSSLSNGATPGIRIEIVLLVLACFNYVRIKRNSLGWGLIGAWSVYTVLFMSGAVPLLLGLIVSTFHLEYQPDDQSTLLLLLLLDLGLLWVLYTRHAPQVMGALLRAIRWEAVGLGLVCAGLGAWFAHEGYPANWSLNPTTLFWFPLLAGIGLCLGVLTGLRRIPDEMVSARAKLLIFNGISLLLLILGVMPGARVLFALALVWGLLYLLHEAPLSLGRVPVLGHVLVGGAFLACAFAGFAVFGGPMIGFPTGWLWGIWGCGVVLSLAYPYFHSFLRIFSS